MAELKPCPFCGGEAEVISENRWDRAYVRCYICRCQTAELKTDFAIKVWNTRRTSREID